MALIFGCENLEATYIVNTWAPLNRFRSPPEAESLISWSNFTLFGLAEDEKYVQEIDKSL